MSKREKEKMFGVLINFFGVKIISELAKKFTSPFTFFLSPFTFIKKETDDESAS